MSSPLLKIPKVGMLITLYLAAVPPLSSTSNFITLSFPAYSFARSSTIGAIILHGPHHVAQKSTRTGIGDFNTSVSNVFSVSALGAPDISPVPPYLTSFNLRKTGPHSYLFPRIG